jgi:hypothetical protein
MTKILSASAELTRHKISNRAEEGASLQSCEIVMTETFAIMGQ